MWRCCSHRIKLSSVAATVSEMGGVCSTKHASPASPSRPPQSDAIAELGEIVGCLICCRIWRSSLAQALVHSASPSNDVQISRSCLEAVLIKCSTEKYLPCIMAPSICVWAPDALSRPGAARSVGVQRVTRYRRQDVCLGKKFHSLNIAHASVFDILRIQNI